MAFVPVPNTVLVELRMTQDSQEVENTLYFDSGAPNTVVAMTGLAGDIASWWENELAVLTHTGVQLREVVVTDLGSATGPQVTFAPPIAAFGGVGGDALPMNVSFSVGFNTAQRGRSFRGRNFFIGLAESQVTGNQVNGGVIAAIVDAYELLLGSPFTDFGAWSVASRFSGVDPTTGKPIPRVTGIATPIISVSASDSIVDSQRRRLPGRGR